MSDSKVFPIMKKFTKIFAVSALVGFVSCVNLDLNPLSEGSSENWYSNQTEIEMALNALYTPEYIPFYGAIEPYVCGPLLGLDLIRRQDTYYTYNDGLNSTNATYYNENRWANMYTSIARSLRIINNMDKARAMGIPEETVKQYEGQAYFFMGLAYGELAFHYGDAILDKKGMTLAEAYSASRAPKADVVAYSMECFDKAAKLLPKSWSGLQRMTQGAAYAYKARYALYNGEYQLAADAAKDCMDLHAYSLHENYGELFTAETSPENIWWFRGDVSLKKYYWLATGSNTIVYNILPRVHGGWGVYGPTYELFCAYPCIDGKPIDKSPLYDYRDPFKNRDPRMSMTIVPFATPYTKSVVDGTYDPAEYAFLGIENSPNPKKPLVTRIADGVLVSNNDSKARAEHSPYNGLLLKKFVDETYKQNGYSGAATSYIHMRLGDVLLMYAEAMNELKKCDQTVLDLTINALRERAYKGTGIEYPKATAGNQAALRTVIRTERFIELAVEGHNYDDLLRWKVAEKYFNRPAYYLTRSGWSGSTSWNGDMNDPSLNADFKALCARWDAGRFPFGGVPAIDENGIADLSAQFEAGDIVQAFVRKFDAAKSYLWPIPQVDIDVNSNLKQNPNY